MEALFFSAFVIAISFAVQPGPIGFEAIRRGIAHGWGAALRVELGSLVGDAVWALIALVGAAFLFQNPLVSFLLGFFGCILLLRFAWDAWRASRSEVEVSVAASRRNDHFAAGAMLSLSNPQNITFWLGMSGVIVGLGFVDPKPPHILAFFSGFMIAQICWCFFFATLVEFGRRLINQRLFRLINRACAVFLACMGLALLLQTAQLSLNSI